MKITRDSCVTALDRSVEYLLYLIIFFIPISKAAIEIVFSIAMTLFFFKKVLRPDFHLLKKPACLFILLFFLFCALSLSNSGPYLAKGLRALFGKWLESVLIFILALDTFNNRQRLLNALYIFLAVAALVSIDGIFQKFSGWDFFHKRLLVEGYPTAGFENQNSLAAYLLPAVILSTLLFLHKSSRLSRCLLSCLALLAGTVLILVSSRGAWLGLFMGLFLWLFLSRNFKKAVIPFFIFIIFLLIVPSSRQRIMHTFNAKGDGQRIILMRSSLDMIKDNPFLGKGLGTYMDYFRQYAPIDKVYYAHNSYLQMWAEAGVFTIISFFLFLWFLFKDAIGAWRKSYNPVILALACAVFGFLVHGFFENHLYSLQLSALCWLILGLLAASASIDLA